jgi:MFS family permease
VGSVVCAAAPNSTTFIVGRAIAGAGSSGIVSGAIVILVQTVPLHKRPMYQGFVGAIFGIASVAGPLLGVSISYGTLRAVYLHICPNLDLSHDTDVD